MRSTINAIMTNGKTKSLQYESRRLTDASTIATIQGVFNAVVRGAIVGGSLQLLVNLSATMALFALADGFDSNPRLPTMMTCLVVLANPFALLLERSFAVHPYMGLGFLGEIGVLLAQGVFYGVTWKIVAVYRGRKFAIRLLVIAHLLAATAAFALTIIIR